MTYVARAWYRCRWVIVCSLLLSFSLVDLGCFLEPKPGRYYGRVIVPQKQEFRWSDGGLPQVFDPALAAAPPDTDAVRALFEGLTDYDPQTLKTIPAVAVRWESSQDARVWTFYLREDARWSSGEPVTANDFVRSWERTLKLGDLAPHTELLSNIVGAKRVVSQIQTTPEPARQKLETANRLAAEGKGEQAKSAGEAARQFGAEAINDYVLRVTLQRPNANFPALVAHPVFRPAKFGEPSGKTAAAKVISNGAFLLAKAGSDSVLLERANNYWGKADVSLDRVEFVGRRDAESALAVYRAGAVDAVTNEPFEPLALKLLTPYQDYRRATYGALTYYSFNTSHRPFDDVRIREALAIAIDRERISEVEMGGATEPASRFLPDAISDQAGEAVVAKSATLNEDLARAKALLAEAGYVGGHGFPVIRLLINRNEQQRQVAQAVATMWRNLLNVETEVIVKNWDEYEAAIRSGDYDLARRGTVMQTTDELTNISMMFPLETSTLKPQAEILQPGSQSGRGVNQGGRNTPGQATADKATPATIESEAEALRQLKAIPIYFASSCALVKPYVTGFDNNMLDSPSLKRIRIETNWQEPKTAP